MHTGQAEGNNLNMWQREAVELCPNQEIGSVHEPPETGRITKLVLTGDHLQGEAALVCNHVKCLVEQGVVREHIAVVVELLRLVRSASMIRPEWWDLLVGDNVVKGTVMKDVRQCHNKYVDSCISVKRLECKDPELVERQVPHVVCADIPEEICHEVPSEDCEDAAREGCECEELRKVRMPEGDEDKDPKKKPKGIVLEALGLAKEENVFSLHNEKGLTLDGTKLRLKYNLKFRVTVRECSSQIGHYRVPVIVGFYYEMHSENMEQGNRYGLSHRAVELLLKVQSEEMKDLRPTNPFTAPERARNWHVRETVVGNRTVKDNIEDQQRKLEKLGHYLIKKDRGKVISSNFQDGDTLQEKDKVQRCKELLEEDLGKEMYNERWKLLLHCEERQLENDIRHYDMADTKLKSDNVKKLFVLEVPGLEENRQSMMKGEKMFIFSHSDNGEYEGFVHLIQVEKVLVGFSNKLSRVFVPGMKLVVRFTVSRFPLRNMRRAVVLSKTSGILFTLFPNTVLLADNLTLPTFMCYDRKIETNPEQFSAVKLIVGGTSCLCSYWVF